MYIETLKEKLSTKGYIHVLRGIANWSNGNLMSLANQLIKATEQKKHQDEETTIDTEAGELTDAQIKAARAEELGYKSIQSIHERGEIFASIHRACVDAAQDLASGRQMSEWDFPRTFEAYIDSLIANKRVNEDTLREEMAASPGRSRAEIVEMLKKAQEENSGKLAEQKKDLIEAARFDNSMNIDEAIGRLTLINQHRMRSKCVDVLMYEVTRLEVLRTKYLNGPLGQTLRSDAYDLIRDAIIVREDLTKFTKMNRAKIDQELTEAPAGSTLALIWPVQAHDDRIERAIRDIKEREEAKHAA